MASTATKSYAFLPQLDNSLGGGLITPRPYHATQGSGWTECEYKADRTNFEYASWDDFCRDATRRERMIQKGRLNANANVGGVDGGYSLFGGGAQSALGPQLLANTSCWGGGLLGFGNMTTVTEQQVVSSG